MRRAIGFVVGAAGVLALAIFFLAPQVPGERAALARMADGGLAEHPRTVYAVAGVVLLGLSGAMMRRR
ncbi:MAG: hypothetical protein KBF28_13295 [Gemmatimonadales bacterium]|jgi:hypothetical protein|nr:hypothetical protein [Acidobacteriota bacterium]MBP9899348.1 hypothetical protein [Gemmatimonadales bacterium]